MSKISLQDLKQERESLERKLTIINLMIDAYSEEEVPEPFELNTFHPFTSIESSFSKEETSSDFPKSSTWLVQILFILDSHNRFLSNGEFAELLNPYHQNKNIHELKRRVSVVISSAYKNDKVAGLIKVSKTNSSKDTVWGYNKWLDSNGEIMRKHSPFKFKENIQMIGH